MRKTIGWGVAALVAAVGCGGGEPKAVSQAWRDEHKGPNAVCAECKVTGGGQFVFGGQTFQFDVQAIPESGPAAGPGFGGVGIAAKGHFDFQVVPASGGGLEVDSAVDTIVSCARVGGVLTATISGTIDGNGRFVAVVTDGGEPEVDTLSFTDTTTLPATAVADGNIQVHDLDRCEQPPVCPEGECPCPDDPLTCEPCHVPTPVVCLEGYCLDETSQTCAPCYVAPIQPLPPPLLPL